MPHGTWSCLAPAEATVLLTALTGHASDTLNQRNGSTRKGYAQPAAGPQPSHVDTYVKRIRSNLSLGNEAELMRAALMSVSE